MELLVPQALALLIPAGLVWWRWLRSSQASHQASLQASLQANGTWLRLSLLLLLVLAAAGPRLVSGRGGSDVVVIFDRSASVDEARSQHPELARLIGDQRRVGDRLGVVNVASEAYVAQAPRATGLPDPALFAIADDGSDLAAGVRTAQALLSSGRSARLLLVSDGEDTGIGLRAATVSCAQAHVPIDVLAVTRPGAVDAAVIDVELPDGLRLGESFVGAARCISEVAERRTWRVLRGDQPIASGTIELQPRQAVTLTFADRPPLARLTEYVVELDAHDDRRPANNRAVSALRISGGERVLVVSGDGTGGNLARALQAAGMRVDLRAEGPLGLADLVGVTALVLEQVPADRLGPAGLAAVAQWVEHLGGGLVLTGGRRGFGAGGYHRSAIERVSPVTMEIRDEQRKLSVAMAITLDRSGSMAAPAGAGKTKMDLADEGACAAIELLGPLDQVAVHAVDSTAHPIIALTRVGNQRASMVNAIRGIRSEGGGIYTYTALLAAGAELASSSASAGTKHLVLFADANDAEEPGDYQQLLQQYQSAGISVSVVAMGTPADSDAKFLEDVARRGGGRITYASDPADIPRLFAQETVLISRTAWVDQALAPQPRSALHLIVPGLTASWPTVPGYNLTYARERAQVLAWCAGDPAAPAAVAWRIGAGRSVALPFNCDDPAAPALMAWPGYAPLLAGVVRWAGGGASAEAPGGISVTRSGRSAVVRLEIDPRFASTATVAPQLTLVGAEPSQEVAWERVDDLAWEARVTLSARVVVPAALVTAPAVDGSRQEMAVSGPALCLPMSPEVEPRYGREPGSAVLASVARDSGGRVRRDLVGMFENPPSPGTGTDLAPWLVAAALLLLIAEIAVRRWHLDVRRWGWQWLRLPVWRRRKAPAALAKPLPPQVVTVLLPAASFSATPSSAAPSAPVPPPTNGGLHAALNELKRRKGR